MRSKTLSGILATAILCSLLLSAHEAFASASIKTLYSFAGVPDGQNPTGALVFDNAGNLYGTTFSGGYKSNGTVFELSPSAGGAWTEKIIYTFAGGNDGANPSAGLIIDLTGNLYGTAMNGGNKACSGGCGTTFRLHPTPSGQWQFKVLHQFKGSDGANPDQILTVDSNGYLYGATRTGGSSNVGVIYQLFQLPHSTIYEFDVLHDFTGGADGAYPLTPTITIGSFFYGVAGGGGEFGKGTAFELFSTPYGPWNFQLLYAFSDAGGYAPESPLNYGLSSGFYGLSSGGGDFGLGTLYELTSPLGRHWIEGAVYSFTGNADGELPSGPLTVGISGDFYATTKSGKVEYGAAVQFSPNSAGGWTETTLVTFDGAGNGGISPQGGVVLDSFGNLYGVTQYGGQYQNGEIYEITP